MGEEVMLHSFIIDECEISGLCLIPMIQGKEPTVPIDYEAV